VPHGRMREERVIAGSCRAQNVAANDAKMQVPFCAAERAFRLAMEVHHISPFSEQWSQSQLAHFEVLGPEQAVCFEKRQYKC
jgi:hypothetical protein